MSEKFPEFDSKRSPDVKLDDLGLGAESLEGGGGKLEVDSEVEEVLKEIGIEGEGREVRLEEGTMGSVEERVGRLSEKRRGLLSWIRKSPRLQKVVKTAILSIMLTGIAAPAFSAEKMEIPPDLKRQGIERVEDLELYNSFREAGFSDEKALEKTLKFKGLSEQHDLEGGNLENLKAQVDEVVENSMTEQEARRLVVESDNWERDAEEIRDLIKNQKEKVSKLRSLKSSLLDSKSPDANDAARKLVNEAYIPNIIYLNKLIEACNENVIDATKERPLGYYKFMDVAHGVDG